MSTPQERREQALDEVELILQRVVLDESALEQIRAIVREEIAAAREQLYTEIREQTAATTVVLNGETVSAFAMRALEKCTQPGCSTPRAPGRLMCGEHAL